MDSNITLSAVELVMRSELNCSTSMEFELMVWTVILQ